MKLKKIVIVALLVCMIFSSVSFAVTKISCVGNSCTSGFKLKRGDDYPAQLGVLLGSEYEVGNFGNAGKCLLFDPVVHNSYWGTSIWQSSIDFEPDIVTIMLGANDCLPENIIGGGLLSQYELDYIDYVNYYQALPSSPRVIVLTCTPIKPGGAREDCIPLVNSVIPNVAAATGAEIIDIWQILMDSGMTYDEMLKDTVHPSAAGSAAIAEALYNYITGGGPVCDDGTCDPGEDECNCPEDCGTPPTTEINCSDGVDDDCDTYTDCDDGDCIGDPACPSCGDATCDAGEDQCNCSEDCGVPPATETNCTDGIDEDCDGEADCLDPTGDCDTDPACDCLGSGASCSDDSECCSNKCRGGSCRGN